MSSSLSQFLEDRTRAPMIVAHRGDWDDHPENSVPAILSAVRKGADMVEIDVQSTKDGVLVLLHDQTVDRTTNGTGRLADLDSAAVAELSLLQGDGEGKIVTGEQLPRLSEVLEAIRGKVLLNIDTNTHEDLDAACAMVMAAGLEDQVLVKGPIDRVEDIATYTAKPWFGRIEFMPLMLKVPKGQLVASVVPVVRALKSRMVELNFHDQDELADLHIHLNDDVWIWTNTLDAVHSMGFTDTRAATDPQGVWGRIMDLGIRVIQTDRTRDLATHLGRF